MTDLQKEFKKYVREEFDCEVIEVPRDEADTFENLFKADFMQLNKQGVSKMIKDNEILEMAEEIAFSIVGDVADNEDVQSSIPLANALYKAGYRKRSDTVKEFAEKLKMELFANCVVIQTISNPQKEDMDSSEAFQIIKELAEQFGKGGRQ